MATRKKRSRKVGEYHYQPQKSIRSKEIAAYRKTFLVVFLTITFLFLIYFWGIPFVANLNDFWESIGLKSNQKKQNSQEEISLPGPRLDPLPNITNQSSIEIKGESEASSIIVLWLNEAVWGETESDSSGQFSFSQVNLKEGENILYSFIKLKDGKRSYNSSDVNITLDTKPPLLEVQTPQDSEVFEGEEDTCLIQGITDPGTFLTINGHQAILESSGKFSYSIDLKSGKNPIEVAAKDKAGNEETVEITVTYKSSISSETTEE